MTLLLCQYEPLRQFLPQHWPGVEVLGAVPLGWESHDAILIPEWITLSGSAYSLHELWDTYLGKQQGHIKLIVYGRGGRKGSNYLPLTCNQKQMEAIIKTALPSDTNDKDLYPSDIPAPSLLSLVEKFVLTHKKNNFFELLDDLQRSLDLVLEQWKEKTPRKEIAQSKEMKEILRTLEVFKQLWLRAEQGFRWMPDYPSLLELPPLIRELEQHYPNTFEQGQELPSRIADCLSGPLRMIRRIYELEKIDE